MLVSHLTVPDTRPTWLRYAVAVVAVVVAVVLRKALEIVWGLEFPLLTFFPAVMVAAWVGGLGPGLAATLMSAAAAASFWVTVTTLGDAMGLGLFVGIGGLMSGLTDALHRARRRETASADEREALLVRERTTRADAEAARETLQALIRSSALGIVMLDSDARVRLWNPAAARIFGWTEEEVLGRPLPVIPPENWREFRANLEVSLRGEVFTGEVRRQRKDGAPIDLSVASSPIRDAAGAITSVVTVVADVTERKRAEEALRESTERLTGIIESAMDAVITIDQDERIMLFNGAAEKMFRCKSSDVIGATLERFIPVAAREVHHRHIRQFGQTGVTSRTMGAQPTLSALRADGEEFPMEATISQTHVASQKLYTVIIRDVSERVRADEERNRLLARERAARTEAEAANRAKDEFLAVLSHELRTPLNAVYGYARMLQAGQLAKEASARALDVIVRNANAQVQLIDDLLDVSRVITGKLRLDVRSVDLEAVVEGALDTVRPAAEAKGIRLQSVLDPGAGPITGDPDRLQQVVWNLLTNALKFSPKGGRVQVHLQRVNSHVEIVVSDMGEGIAPDILPFVFDRFRQGDSSTSRPHAGLGLGLALVKHLVELHGGTVAAQSPGVGLGATFIVKLPLSIAQLPPEAVPRVHPTAASRQPSSAGARLDGLRLLIVDDDPDAVDLETAILTRAGAIVRGCGSASEALEVLREWRPDVLVSDIEMPGEDGYSLIRKVRALDETQGGRTPAVALTAYGRSQDRVLSLSAGYSMHVPKPVDPGEFTTIIASLAARPLKPSTPSTG
jgi:PAS domain S-box-containing protein